MNGPGTFLGFLEEARPFALGLLGLKPHEFYRYTPAEFNEVVKGYEDRRHEDDRRTAGFVAIIANTCGHLKRPITAEKILGKKARRKTAATPEASGQRDRLREMTARMNASRGKGAK